MPKIFPIHDHHIHHRHDEHHEGAGIIFQHHRHQNHHEHDKSNDHTSLHDGLHLEKLIKRVAERHILGPKITGRLRQFCFEQDLFKEEQFIRSPKLYSDFNALFASIYAATIVFYSTVVFISFLNQVFDI